MFRFFPFVLIIQAFCLYHAYKNNSDQKWYWLIIFIPLLGCLLYLYHHFYSRENLEKVSETFKESADSNYRVRKFESEVIHNDSFENKERLADEYFINGRFDDAISYYQSCLSGVNANDPTILRKLIAIYYRQEKYEDLIEQAKILADDREFADSIENSYYAWALHHQGKNEAANQIFEGMDVNYTNYFQRIEYARFLKKVDRSKEAYELLTQIGSEYNRLSSREKKVHRGLGAALRKLGAELDS